VALILAINPGGKHSAALARLARELSGHEVNGADSCAVAITAVGRRVPDLVLLPPLPESEEADLLARLRQVPGGVRTLKLPTLTSDDPRFFTDFAGLVRATLAAPPGVSPGPADERRAHLIAAATALADWVRARRATWSDAVTTEPPREAPSKTGAREFALKPAAPPTKVWKPIEEATEEPETRPAESVRESGVEVAARHWDDWREPVMRWLPRVAALAVLAALAAAAFTYLPKLRTSFTSGTLVLESGPPGSLVFVDGRLAGTTPISVELPAGRHSVEFRSGDMSRTTDVAIVARGRVIERVDWLARPSGSLQVQSNPAGARVLLDGALHGTTPLTLESVPVGTYTVTIESTAGSVKRTVTIGVGKTVQMAETIFPGWLAVFAPFEIEITEGSALIRPDNGGRAMLPAGPHVLRFRNRELGYDEVRKVEITPGDTITLNLAPQTTISITAAEPSEVWIDGKRVGQTPLTKLRINLGSRVILIRPASGVGREFTVTATAKPIQIDMESLTP
jgi:hypothetical protein